MPDVDSGLCDSHTHVFPPADRFPLAFETSYMPPPADIRQHLAMLDANGMTFGVVVQPGVYGTDPAALLDALECSGSRLHAVAAVDGNTRADTLARLHEKGVRGLRFTEVRDPVSGGRYRGTVGADALPSLAAAMRDIGLHAQLWSPLSTTLSLADLLRSSGVPVVLDHMGMIDAAAGTDDRDFQTLLDLIDEGWLWVKLSLCRVAKRSDFADIRPFHDALISRAPERMLWASDWPFVRMDPAPDPETLRDMFLDWVPDRAIQTLILKENPARLYGFERTSP
jgi:predicted TIM-barrel fold metal-dependent hydrolase